MSNAAPEGPVSQAPRVDTVDAPPSHVLQRNAVGVRHLVFFVIAAAAPLTVSAGFLPLGFTYTGSVLPAAFVIAGISYAVFAVGFTAMSRYVPDAGAFSAYIRTGLGRRAGGSAALVAWASYTLGQIGFNAAAGYFLSLFLGKFGVTVPWGVCALVIALAVVAVSCARINVGARVAALLLMLEIGVLTVFVVAVWIRGVPEGYSLTNFNPATWQVGTLGAALVIGFLVFIGFEQTAVYSEEVRTPRRAIPRATYVAIAILTLIYTVVSWTILMATGPSGLAAALADNPSGLVFGLNASYVGQAMTDLMQALVVTSFVAGVLALQNAGSRYLFSMSRQRLLPEALSRTTGSGNPRLAVLTQSAVLLIATIGFGVSGLDPYTQVVIWTNTPTLFGVLALQIATSIAVIRWFARRPDGENLWTRLIAPALATLLLTAAVVLGLTNMSILSGTGALGNLLILLPLILAVGVGLLLGGRTSRRRPDPVLEPEGDRS